MRSRWTIVVCMALLGAALFASRPAATAPDGLVGDATETVTSAGIGERLVLVVAADTAPTEAASKLGAVNAPFGELQGFYVDRSDHYDVTGILVQTTPDAIGVRCPSPGAVFEKVVASVPLDLECPAGISDLQVLQPVGLRTYSAGSVHASVFPEPCGTLGLAPCQADRYRAMLGDDLRFASGRSLILTGFRTKTGAEQFVELARTLGVRDLVVVQALKIAGGDIGLGQEPHPDGSGPLTGPLAGQEQYQK